jgi:hypothetical protein
VRATLTEGASRELELSASTGEWLSFADVLEAGEGAIECSALGPVSAHETRLKRLVVRPEDRAKLLLDANPTGAVVSGSPEILAQFGRLVREFANKSRRGQIDAIGNRGPEHFIDRASIPTLFHMGGEAAHRDGDVGG